MNNIENGNLIDASIKRAPKWFTSRGLQLPKLVQTILSANTKIPQDNSVVNSNSMQNSEKDAKELHSDRDSHYLDLAKDPEKNKAELQKTVDEAAREAGYCCQTRT